MKSRISVKILSAVLAVSFVFMAIFGLINYNLDKDDLFADLVEHTKSTTNRLSHSLANPLWNVDGSEIARIVDYETREENIRAVLVRNEHGRLVAARLKKNNSHLILTEQLIELHKLSFEKSYFTATHKIFKDDHDIGTVAVYAEDAPIRVRLQQHFFRFVILIALFFFGISATLFLVLRHNIIKPLNQLERAVSGVSLENLNARIDVSGDDEIAHLADRFSQMVQDLKNSLEQQKQMNQQLVQAQKLEAVGMLVSGISHDYNNILGAIIGSAEMLSIWARKEDLQQRAKFERHVSTIQNAGQRATELIRQLLALSMKHDANLVAVDLRTVVRDVVKLLQSSQDKSIDLQLELPGEVAMVYADRVQMEQVLLNLCINACHAMTIMRPQGEDWGGELRISLKQINSLPGQNTAEQTKNKATCALTVADTGIGMQEEIQQEIFTPFFTTKNQGVGSGLGLAMVYNIIKQHNGHLFVESEANKGSIFHIYMPAFSQGELHEPGRKAAEQVLPQAKGLVLFVDDEPGLQEIGAQILTECGLDVLIAPDGSSAVDLAQQHGPEIQVVILDMNMPIMSGRTAYPKIKGAAPEAKILLTSGYSEDPRVLEMQGKEQIDGFLCKPYSVHELVSAVYSLLQ